MNKLTYILVLLIILLSCKSKKIVPESTFPEVKNVTTLKKTDFTLTLDAAFSNRSNIIYGATIPFAWNEIKTKIASPLKNFTNPELEALHNFTGFFDVLQKDEYETLVEIDGNEISAKAHFKKSLPFKTPLTKFEESLKFGSSNVESFGFLGKCNCAAINYFNNENDFSITLFPEDSNHEIVLMLSQTSENAVLSFGEYLKILSMQQGEDVAFDDFDKVEIPIIELNLEKTFEQLIGSTFNSELTAFKVTDVYQRNAFVLNEKGSEIESEAELTVQSVSAEIEKPTPKMMIFDRPFVVFLKRKGTSNPYMGIYIANDELLKKK